MRYFGRTESDLVGHYRNGSDTVGHCRIWSDGRNFLENFEQFAFFIENENFWSDNVGFGPTLSKLVGHCRI